MCSVKAAQNPTTYLKQQHAPSVVGVLAYARQLLVLVVERAANAGLTIGYAPLFERGVVQADAVNQHRSLTAPSPDSSSGQAQAPGR